MNSAAKPLRESRETPTPSEPPISSGVSVIIRCHNSAQRLPKTLQHLARQHVPNGIEWEVIVVNNASTDDTRHVAESSAPDFAPDRLSVVDEPKPGHNYARIRGVKAARFEFLSFVDDDNWVADDWVVKVFEFFGATPEAGAVGGIGTPFFENNTAPEWFPKFSAAYATGPQYEHTGDITNEETSLLWGAGLSVRKSVFMQLHNIGFEVLPPTRSGAANQAGEDVELCQAIRALGWRLHYTPSFHYQHYIPQQRLKWSYLRQIFRKSGQEAIYSRVLSTSTNSRIPNWRLRLERRWMFQLLYFLRALAKAIMTNPRAFFSDAEGSSVRLQIDALIGSLDTISRLRGGYDKLFDDHRIRFRKTNKESIDFHPENSANDD